MPDRAVVFVDGNNVYHGLANEGLQRSAHLSYLKIALKIVQARTLTEVRYYVGQVTNTGDKQLYDDQQRFIDRQKALDPRIKFVFGRIEPRPVPSECAKEILTFLETTKATLNFEMRHRIQEICWKHEKATVMVEKAVDVALAIDVVTMADAGAYDTAYIFSADGDYTPAINFAKAKGRNVFGVSVSNAGQLAAAVGTGRFLRLDARVWFDDCYI